MESRRHGFWHTAREYVTHWSIAGAILALTGAAPEHWFARLLEEIDIPRDILPTLPEHIDLRLLAVIAGLTIIVGDTLWRHHKRDAHANADIPSLSANPAVRPELPEKPSIAVLAFENLAGKPEYEFFSDGVADDIITELSHDRSLFVIARNSSFTYKGHATDVKQIARDLGVRYVLEGSVQRDTQRMRVNVQLIDAESGNHIWAEHFNRTVEDVFSVQDEIVIAATRAIHPVVSEAEQRRALRKHPENLGAWEAYQHALWHLNAYGVEENEKATEFLLRAIKLDPMLASAQVMLTITMIFDSVVYGVAPLSSEYFEKCVSQARKAVSIDPGDADAQAVLAWVTGATGAVDEAWDRISRLIDANPNSHYVNNIAALILTYTGRAAQAPPLFAKGMRINPRDPVNPLFITNLGVACYYNRDYAGSVRACKRAIAEWPTYPQPYRYLAAAHGQLCQGIEAGEALSRAYATAPGMLEKYTHTRPPFVRPEDFDHLLDGLRKAGWHE